VILQPQRTARCCTVPVVGDVAIGSILFTEDRFSLKGVDGLGGLMVQFHHFVQCSDVFCHSGNFTYAVNLNRPNG